MTRIRLVQRRNRIEATRVRAEDRVTMAILPLLRSQMRHVERFLRRGNLRKRMSRLHGGEDWDRADALLKQYQQPNDEGEWNVWKAAFLAALLAALAGAVSDLGDEENEVWMSRGYDHLTFTAEQILQDYQLRSGRNLSTIADDTMDRVKEEISSWYVSGEPFPVLMRRMERLFDETRARLIASVEVSHVSSQVVLQAMISNGWFMWSWDAELDWRTCKFCEGMHGRVFRLGDPMPPDAAHPGCRCQPVPVTDRGDGQWPPID